MTVCGWINRRQLAAIEYLREENRVLREQLGTKRLVFSDAQRRRLALKGKALNRELLNEVCSIVTPANNNGKIRCRERAEGLLKHYCREAA